MYTNPCADAILTLCTNLTGLMPVDTLLPSATKAQLQTALSYNRATLKSGTVLALRSHHILIDKAAAATRDQT